jgi:acyl-CoA thioesterase II
MDAFTFLGLEHVDDGRYRLPVTPDVATASKTIFGGAASATVATISEHATERPLIYSALAFPSTAFIDEVIELTIEPITVGRRVTNARVEATKNGGEPVFGATVACGLPGEDDFTGRWSTPLEVPDVDECEPRQPREGTADARVEFRPARIRRGEERSQPSPDGRFAMWLRIPDLDPGVATVAKLGDYVNSFVGQALGERATTKSLDNALRVVERPTDEWVLLDVQIQAVAGGFAHGEGRLYSRAGDLLAIAQQTTTARPRR